MILIPLKLLSFGSAVNFTAGLSLVRTSPDHGTAYDIAGKGIAEHIDEAGIYKYAHRVHIPIITNEGCVFTIDGEDGRMSAGEIVEINNTVPHSVVNGDTDRVHLIVDIMGIHKEFDMAALKNPVPKQFYLEED